MKDYGWDYDFNNPAQIPFSDTRAYVQKVLNDRDNYQNLYKKTLKNY